MRCFRFAILLVTAGTTCAHTGFENETEVRIYAERMEVNTRATFAFAWKLLGKYAPADTGESAKMTATPVLTELAPGLFRVAADGVQMTPRNARCVFELDDHVFLRSVYDRPPAWPLELRATFFGQFDPMTYGTIKVFDQTGAPYQRDIEAIDGGEIHRGRPAFVYDPTPAAEADGSSIPAPAPPTGPETPVFRWYFAALLILILLLSGWRWFSRSPRK